MNRPAHWPPGKAWCSYCQKFEDIKLFRKNSNRCTGLIDRCRKAENIRLRAISHKRRSGQNKTDVTAEWLEKIKKEAKFCPALGIQLTDMPGLKSTKQIDHIIPLNKGGGHYKNNIWIVSAIYNQMKGDSLEDVTLV